MGHVNAVVAGKEFSASFPAEMEGLPTTAGSPSAACRFAKIPASRPHDRGPQDAEIKPNSKKRIENPVHSEISNVNSFGPACVTSHSNGVCCQSLYFAGNKGRGAEA